MISALVFTGDVDGNVAARGVVAGSASESSSGAARDDGLALIEEGLVLVTGMAMGEVPSGEGDRAMSRVRKAAGRPPKRFVRIRGTVLLSCVGSGAGAEESDVSSSVSSVGGVERFFFNMSEGSSPETLDSLRTSEPCCFSGLFTLTFACCERDMVVTGVRGGGEDGSVDGESGRDSLLAFPLDDVGEPSEGILGLRRTPNSDEDDNDGSLDLGIRGIRNAGAIGDDWRFSGTIRLTEVSESQPALWELDVSDLPCLDDVEL